MSRQFEFVLGAAVIAAGALAGFGLAMGLIAAQRSPIPPAPVDTAEIRHIERMVTT